MSSELVDYLGRPFYKHQIEEYQNAINSSGRADSIVGSLLPGPNPVLFEEVGAEWGNRAGDEYDLTPYLRFSDASQQQEMQAEVNARARRGIAEEKADVGAGVIIPTAYHNERFAHKQPISELDIPRDTPSLMTLCMRYEEDNYMVQSAVRVKKNFALKDMTIKGTATAREFHQREFARLRIRHVLSTIFRYYWICGRVVAYWGDDRPIKNITVLDPRFIRVQKFMGEAHVMLRPDPRWRTILMADKDNQRPEARFLRKNLPKYWIKHIMMDEDIILKPGSYALIENDLSEFSTRGVHGLGGVPLSGALVELAIFRMLLAGDFSVAWMMKNMIALVSIGNPETEKDKYVRADTTELTKLKTAFQRPEYAMWAYVDATLQIRYVYPDPKLWTTDKYKEITAHINRVLAMPNVFTNADGDFASSALELKFFREEIICGRMDVLEQFLMQLFPVLREGRSRREAGTKDPSVEFDNDCLIDDNILMQMNQGKFDRGALSVRSLLENKAQDFETERERKLAEKADVDAKLWQPAYDISHGDPELQRIAAQSRASGPNGRPVTTNRPTNEKTTGSRTPRPSG